MAKNTIEKFMKNKSKMSKLRRTITCLAAVVVFATTYALILPAMTLDGSDAQKTPGIDTKTEINVEKFGQSLGGDQDSGSDVADNAAQAVNSEEKDVSGGEGDLQSEGNGEEAPEAAMNSEGEKANGSDSKVGSDNKANDVKDGAKKDNAGSKDSKTADDNKDKKGGSKDLSLITEKTEIKFDGKGYKVIAEVGADAKLPADTKLKVREIKKETKDEDGVKYAYDTYCDEALKAVRNKDGEDGENLERQVKLYDIKFTSESSGLYKVEPAAPVKVTFKYDEAIARSDKNVIRVVHFDDTDMDKDKAAEAMIDKDKLHEVKKVVLEAKSEKNDADSMKDVQFKSDRFSVYGIVYTVAKENEEQAATDEDMRVLTANGDTYTVTVSFGEDAKIPENAELRVKEIKEDDEEYKAVQEKAGDELSKKIKNQIPQHPVLFDIAIFDGDQEIEPAEGSTVKVEVKMAKDSVNGVFTDEDSPLLINDEPVDADEQEMNQDLKVIHDVKEGELEVVDVDENSTKKNIVGEFETESFSNWLVYLDETLDEMNVTTHDSLTLRPFTEWVWKADDELAEYQGGEWIFPSSEWESWSNSDNGVNCTFYRHRSNGSVFRSFQKFDDQLNERYTVVTSDSLHTGTFDIKTNKGKTIHIHVTEGAASPKPGTVSGIPGLKVNLFDYDVPSKNGQFDFTKSGNLDSEGNKATTVYDETVNVGHNLKFLGWGADGDNHGVNSYTKQYAKQTIVKPSLEYGVPVLNDGSNQSLGYLFNTNSKNSSVYAFPNVGGLFQQDDRGYYYYNSNLNYAEYNKDTNQFILYEHTYSQHTPGSNGSNAKPIGFFPFHEYDTGDLDQMQPAMNHNKDLNHHFGMSMEVDFEIPSDGLDDYGNPITFEFSGDDDMWVFIDDNLVLDVGGIHQPVTGKIDFSADKVSVFGVDDTSITQRFIDAGSPTAWAIGDGRPHTMKVFYLERGGCDSNLSLKFNTPTRFGKGKLSLVKREANKEKPLEGAVFKIWNNAKREGEPIGTFRSKADGTIDFGEFVIKSANDTFYMEEVESPTGYVRDTSIYQVRPRVGGNGDVVKDSNGYIILDVYKAGSEQPLSKLANDSVVFPNNKIGTINIPAKKTWVGTPTEGAQVTLTVKRYKLIDITKGFVIEKKLTGDPEGYTFVSHYVITYPDGHQVSVPYSDFQDGKYGLADAVPGKYIVEEVVTGNGPDGYNMTHSEQTIEVTLQEDGTAKADFNTTFAKKTGKLNISASVTVQNGNASDIDYSKVRYAVLDSEGKKVTSITHEQAVNGAEIDLPVGTYTVKAVGVPKTPTNLKLTEQKVNGTDGTVSGALNIVDGQTTDAAFSTKYTKQNNAQNCTWKVTDTHINKQYASGKVEYPLGTQVKMSFQVDQNQVWGGDGNYSASYGGQNLNCTCSNVQGNYEYSVTFTVQENKELVVKVNGKDNNGQKNVNVIGPRFELVGSAKNSVLNSFSKSSSSVQKKAAPQNALKVSKNNEAKHPAAPEGKKYIKDDDWSSTVTLNSGNSWEDNSTLSNLPATDNEGNKYYYYVAAVNETGLEDGTICEIDLQNGKQLLIGDDLNQNQTLGVTNTRMGALQINKNVIFSGHAPENAEQKKALAGTYSFKIYTDKNCSDDKAIKDGDQDKVLTVTIDEDGVAKSSEIITLPVGTYWIKEIVSDDALVLPVGENPKEVTITDGDTVNQPKTVEVTNDCDFNEEDDDITVDIVKRFEGLNNSGEIPEGYHAVLSYKLKNGTPQTVDLNSETYQNTNGVHVKVTKSQDPLQWTWHVYRIPKDSTDFKIQEENYTNPDYRLSVTINGETVQNPQNPVGLDLSVPTASFEPVAKDKITAESTLKKYYVSDEYILMVSVNPHGTVVLSDSSLNYQERTAIKNAVESGSMSGSFSRPVRFFSTEQHQTVIKLDNKRTITVTKENGRYVVQLPPNTNSQALGYTVKYNNEDVVNNAEIVNTYIGKEVPVEIIKVDKDTLDKEKKNTLKGAKFTITQLDENSSGGYKEKPDSTTNPKELYYQATVETDDQGRAVSSNLKKGFYEIVETKAPSGYVITTEKFYIKVQDGAVTRIKKAAGNVNVWPEETDNSGMIRFTPSSGDQVTTTASFTVGNEKGAALPNAGGPGTTWIYLLGAMLTLGAGMSFVVRRRMRA